MTNLIKWNPLREFHDVTTQLSDLMNTGSRSLYGGEGQGILEADWVPAVDITEDETGYRIDAEVPGIQREDIKVVVENGKLTLQGNRKFETEENSGKVHRVERSHGSFTRNFRVPEDADGSSVSAEFKNGILSVLLPKSEESKPKQIEVEVL